MPIKPSIWVASISRCIDNKIIKVSSINSKHNKLYLNVSLHIDTWLGDCNKQPEPLVEL